MTANEHKIRILKGKIARLKIALSKSDYKAIKYAEGEISAEEYTPIRDERRAWRAEINRLEAELEAVKSSTMEATP